MTQSRSNKPVSKDKPVLVIDQTEYFDARSHRIQVYVDWVALIRTLGGKAVRNKSGRASLMYGSIIVKAR